MVTRYVILVRFQSDSNLTMTMLLILEQLIIARADLEARDNHQHTPLNYATRWGNIKMVQLLLERNPSILEAKDNDGNTPLHLIVGK